MKRYRLQMASLQTEFNNGYMGTGHAAKRLGAGAIVMIVTDEALKVSRCVMMKGMTFFAKFQPLPQYEGKTIAELQAALASEPEKSSLRLAATSAINQILRVKRDRDAKQAIPSVAHA
jgi:DNA-binding transcriptional regulator of glucitol operon